MIDSKETLAGGVVGAGLLAIWNWFQKGREQGRMEATYATKAEVEAKLKDFVTRDVHCITHQSLDQRLDAMEKRADERHSETMATLHAMQARGDSGMGSSSRF